MLGPWRRTRDDPRIAENLRDGFPILYSVRDARRFIASVRDVPPLGVLAIVHDGEPIGCIGLTPGSDVYRLNGEIGHRIGVTHWGKGLVTEAVSAFVRAVWERTAMERLHAGVFSGNPGSERVLEKCGFLLGVGAAPRRDQERAVSGPVRVGAVARALSTRRATPIAITTPTMSIMTSTGVPWRSRT